jgi:hypothetical protein
VRDPFPIAAQRPAVELPQPQVSRWFDFQPVGADGMGRLQYKVTINAGGAPSLVAASKLTPLFRVDGQDAVSYVSAAYFQSNPGRTPNSIQPGDSFLLTLPADTFVVRWQQNLEEHLAHHGYLTEYVSERGDRLRYYLTDPFPLRFELLAVDAPERAVIQFHPDLSFMLQTGKTDPTRLAKLVYRVEEPDIFQVERMRKLATTLKDGVPASMEVDRTRQFLDPVREAMTRAERLEPVAEPERAHLTRAIVPAEADLPFLAVEDSLGTRTSLADVEAGRVFRIEYGRDGTVRVSYQTGPEDAMGKRDPYLLRENERWEALYRRLSAQRERDLPIKWGPAEPADLDPFPTARDPLARSQDPKRQYDYLAPGRVIVLTFRPVRLLADLRTELEFKELLSTLRDRYRTQLVQLADFLGKTEDGAARGSP